MFSSGEGLVLLGCVEKRGWCLRRYFGWWESEGFWFWEGGGKVREGWFGGVISRV